MFLWCFQHRTLLKSAEGFLGFCFVEDLGLELFIYSRLTLWWDPPASAYWVRGLRVYTPPSTILIYDNRGYSKCKCHLLWPQKFMYKKYIHICIRVCLYIHHNRQANSPELEGRFLWGNFKYSNLETSFVEVCLSHDKLSWGLSGGSSSRGYLKPFLPSLVSRVPQDPVFQQLNPRGSVGLQTKSWVQPLGPQLSKITNFRNALLRKQLCFRKAGQGIDPEGRWGWEVTGGKSCGLLLRPVTCISSFNQEWVLWTPKASWVWKRKTCIRTLVFQVCVCGCLTGAFDHSAVVSRSAWSRVECQKPLVQTSLFGQGPGGCRGWNWSSPALQIGLKSSGF